MKLTSMTDFVLEQAKELDGYFLADNMIVYANFLKKPLTLDMFIGDKALFENADEIRFKINYTVEDLVEYDLTLTPNALKQLGL